MCNYIKDDGEQCGMDDHDGDFCHHHDDTRFAALWRRCATAVEQSFGVEMERTCGECEAPLRRTERLSAHPNMNNRLVFEAVVECDCDEHVLGTKSVRTSDLPEGWQS